MSAEVRCSISFLALTSHYVTPRGEGQYPKSTSFLKLGWGFLESPRWQCRPARIHGCHLGLHATFSDCCSAGFSSLFSSAFQGVSRISLIRFISATARYLFLSYLNL